MGEAAFSENGKYYAAINSEGRLRIWDTETNVLKQEYTPDLHLTSPPSCIQWISVAANALSPRKTKKKLPPDQNSENIQQYIALGTKSGKILLYSISQAKVTAVLVENTEIHNRNIISVDWHKEHGLFSCYRQHVVIEWDLNSGAVKNKYSLSVDSKNKQSGGLNAIKIVPHNLQSPAKFLVTASWQIRIWKLLNGNPFLVKTLGHSSSPRALLSVAVSDKKTWLLEGSQKERLISLWDIGVADDQSPYVNGDDSTPKPKHRRKSSSEGSVITTPVYNFVLEDAPKFMDIKIEEDNISKLTLTAVTRSGVIHYYEHIMNEPLIKPIKPSVTVLATSPDATPLLLQCCKLRDNGDLLLGYVNDVSFTFEIITPDTEAKTQVLIRGESKKTKKIKQKEHTNEINKVRADNNLDTVKYVEPIGTVNNRKRPIPAGLSDVPMEERLANLALNTKSTGKTPVSHNMTKLLIQGLRSKEKKIIQSVLQNDDPAVATTTLSNFPLDFIPLLLEQLIEMANAGTIHCNSVCCWYSALVRSHCSVLEATANLGSTGESISKLLGILGQRRSGLFKLLDALGRLKHHTERRKSRYDEVQNQEPLINYIDSDASDEEHPQDIESTVESIEDIEDFDDEASEMSCSD